MSFCPYGSRKRGCQGRKHKDLCWPRWWPMYSVVYFVFLCWVLYFTGCGSTLGMLPASLPSRLRFRESASRPNLRRVKAHPYQNGSVAATLPRTLKMTAAWNCRSHVSMETSLSMPLDPSLATSNPRCRLQDVVGVSDSYELRDIMYLSLPR